MTVEEPAGECHSLQIKLGKLAAHLRVMCVNTYGFFAYVFGYVIR